MKVDILIVGGGITGVSTAHLLGKLGKSVALVERSRLGRGDTSHTTAHLTYMTDTRLSELITVCGREKAEMAWHAGKAAMDHIKTTAAYLDRDVGLSAVPGYLAVSTKQHVESELKTLEEEARTAFEMGFHVSLFSQTEPTTMPGICFSNQLKFHPMRYLEAIAESAAGAGVMIFENTDVSEFGSDPSYVMANGHRIDFSKVIIATHVPLQGNRGTVGAALFQTKLASYSTYAIAASVPKGSLQEMIWSDTADPFYYLRVEKGDTEDQVIFGGADHKTGKESDTENCYANLESELARMIPGSKVTHRWCGQVVETADGLPYIGETAADQFIATGFSGNGMTFGVVAALMAADWVEGRDNEWTDTFSPTRLEFSALPTYLMENKDYPVHMVKDRIGIPDSVRPQPGEGAVTKVDGKNSAIYCDENGKVHQLSAVCPHMGGIVVWNSAEKTWDCPCHGSRFTACGGLISGPAEKGLSSLAG